MSKPIIALDAVVKAARTLCDRPSIGTAVAFWIAEREAHRAAGFLSWDALRVLLIERHGADVLAVITWAAMLRARYLAEPKGSARRRPSGSDTAPKRERGYDRVSVYPR